MTSSSVRRVRPQVSNPLPADAVPDRNTPTLREHHALRREEGQRHENKQPSLSRDTSFRSFRRAPTIKRSQISAPVELLSTTNADALTAPNLPSDLRRTKSSGLLRKPTRSARKTSHDDTVVFPPVQRVPPVSAVLSPPPPLGSPAEHARSVSSGSSPSISSGSSRSSASTPATSPDSSPQYTKGPSYFAHPKKPSLPVVHERFQPTTQSIFPRAPGSINSPSHSVQHHRPVLSVNTSQLDTLDSTDMSSTSLTKERVNASLPLPPPSSSRANAPPSQPYVMPLQAYTSSQPPDTPLEQQYAHPFGPELAQVKEIVESMQQSSVTDELLELDEEEERLCEQGMLKYSADEYIAEIEGLFAMYFDVPTKHAEAMPVIVSEPMWL